MRQWEICQQQSATHWGTDPKCQKSLHIGATLPFLMFGNKCFMQAHSQLFLHANCLNDSVDRSWSIDVLFGPARSPHCGDY